MSNIEFNFAQATVKETYSAEAERKAKLKYSFNFTMDEDRYRVWYNSDKDIICFDCDSYCERSLREFVLALAQLIKLYAGMYDIDDLDLRKFAVKHFKAAMKVAKELAKLS
jgi:hypothetical protein